MIGVLLFSFATNNANGQSCLPDGKEFKTQNEVDNFGSLYSWCKKIEGNVKISGQDIINLDAFGNIYEIEGFLEVVDNPNLTSVEGLNKLEKIGLYCEVRNNLSLVELDGFRSLRNIEDGDFIFRNNPKVDDLIGLHTLTVVRGDVTIDSLPRVKSLYGLNSIYNIIGEMRISHNDSLQTLTGLSNLTFCNSIILSDNKSLEDVVGFLDLYQKDTDIKIIRNESLKDLSGLNILNSIGTLELINNSSLDIKNNLGIKVINGDLRLESNSNLENLTGLDSLLYVKGHLFISENMSLTSLAGLNNINSDSILSISINNNSSLSQCEVESVCHFISNHSSQVSIENNLSNCNSISEVDSACMYSNNPEEYYNTPYIYPIPASSKINIGGLDNVIIMQIRLYSFSGNLIGEFYNNPKVIDVSRHQPGLYILEIGTEKSSYRYKLIITR